jgi:hypothetical protein
MGTNLTGPLDSPPSRAKDVAKFELPYGYYDVYRLTDKKPSETGKSRLERMHLFLTEDDMRKDRYNVMHCEELFDQYRKELMKTKKIIL